MTIRPLAPDDPRQIGRYRILGELGSGGMGRVLLGTGSDGRLVAIKQVHAHLLDEVEYRARFRREVAATTRVSGAFTAPVIDFDVDSATPWLASVFVIGLPLDKVVAEYGPLPPTAVRRLATGLASALQAIHQAGLIHRDLKPANVMLAADGPRVIDFGIASMTESPGGLTETGSVLGSPAYMSPEQALSEPLTPASDVFSLGSVLMMAATGSPPFAGQSLAYTLFNIAHTQPNLESLPAELRTLIEPCLHKDPAARPTPAQILDFLGDPLQHDLPWPEPVHHEIDRQHTELTAVAADPNATSVLPGARRFTRAGALPDIDGPHPQRKRNRRAAALTALAVLVVIAMAVTTAVVWFRGNDAPAQATVRELTLAQVREADTCAWLKQALGERIPADIAGEFPAEVFAWQLEPDNYRWGCTSGAQVKDLYFSFSAGAFLIATDSTSERVPEGSYGAGQPILGDPDPTTCHRSIRSAEHSSWGLSVSANVKFCRQAEYILERLAAVDNIPQLPDVATSLAAVDPCTLTDPATLRPLIGAVPDTPSEVYAHSCEWAGSASVEITTRRGNDSGNGDDPVIDLGRGRQLIAPNPTVDGICHRQYIFRRNGKEYEAMEIRAQSGADGMNEQLCAIAESVARNAVDRLPELPR